MRDSTVPNVHEYHLVGCLAVCALGLTLAATMALVVAYKAREQWMPRADPIGYSGNFRRGRALVTRVGCPSCHVIPDAAPQGMVGPPLTSIGRRSYNAGRFPNDEIWMILWLEDPQALKPGTAMPNLDIGERDARDIAAYLATLR
jgi:cytochrome c